MEKVAAISSAENEKVGKEYKDVEIKGDKKLDSQGLNSRGI
jgi:hypothetical protein